MDEDGAEVYVLTHHLATLECLTKTDTAIQ
jgi:hypothetical protein